MAAAYAAIAGVVAGMTTSTSVRPAPLQSLLVPYGLALTCGTLGALRHDRLGRRLMHRLPRAVVDSMRAGARAVVQLLAVSVALVVLMLLAHLDLATHLGQSLHAGAIGGGALLAVNAAFLVTAVAWALAYVVGTGFSVGVHTGVSPFAHHLGAVPDLPVLAAIPSGPSPSWAPILVALPVLAGVLAGWRLAGRSRRLAWWQVPLTGLGAGVVAGLLVAAITGLSGGPAGSGRLVTVGPSAWQAGLAAAAEIGLQPQPSSRCSAGLRLRRSSCWPGMPGGSSAAASTSSCCRRRSRDRPEGRSLLHRLRRPTRAADRYRLTTTVPTILSAKVCFLASHSGHSRPTKHGITSRMCSRLRPIDRPPPMYWPSASRTR